MGGMGNFLSRMMMAMTKLGHKPASAAKRYIFCVMFYMLLLLFYHT